MTMRAVKRSSPQTQLTPQGAKLHLECGHVMWNGGRESIPDATECLQSPCYRPQREMGHCH